MQKILLFDEKVRMLEGPANYNNDIYDYYNDSARNDIGNIRNMLEAWFLKYPEEEKEELKSRFKASFNPTFYELYIFMLFTNLGYDLEIHPEVPNSSTRPDYLAKKDSQFIYIEVKYMTMLSQKEQSLERRKNALLDALNKVDSKFFLLKLQSILFKDNTQPSGKQIIHFFNKELASHDPDVYTDLLMKNGFNGMPNIVYEDGKVKIETQLFPKSPLYRGTDSRSIGSFPITTQIGNDSENIITSLESKATHYGHLDAPFVICLNKQSVSLDLIEVQEALYGAWQVSWSENPTNRDEKLQFAGNGFFGARHNPKFTRVSAVYITNANTANLTTTAEHAFRHNSFAKYPIDLVINQSIEEILNIYNNYPYDNNTI